MDQDSIVQINLGLEIFTLFASNLPSLTDLKIEYKIHTVPKSGISVQIKHSKLIGKAAEFKV